MQLIRLPLFNWTPSTQVCPLHSLRQDEDVDCDRDHACSPGVLCCGGRSTELDGRQDDHRPRPSMPSDQVMTSDQAISSGLLGRPSLFIPVGVVSNKVTATGNNVAVSKSNIIFSKSDPRGGRSSQQHDDRGPLRSADAPRDEPGCAVERGGRHHVGEKRRHGRVGWPLGGFARRHFLWWCQQVPLLQWFRSLLNSCCSRDAYHCCTRDGSSRCGSRHHASYCCVRFRCHSDVADVDDGASRSCCCDYHDYLGVGIRPLLVLWST